jgi:hypothetical protein
LVAEGHYNDSDRNGDFSFDPIHERHCEECPTNGRECENGREGQRIFLRITTLYKDGGEPGIETIVQENEARKDAGRDRRTPNKLGAEDIKHT